MPDPQERELTPIHTTPFMGGQNSFVERALLPFGSYSKVMNMRQMRPGIKARPGMFRQHTVGRSASNLIVDMMEYSTNTLARAAYVSNAAGIELDLMEYASNAAAQAAYVSNLPYGFEVATGGTPLESGHYASYDASLVFDKNDATFWSEYGLSLPTYVGYDFGAGNAKDLTRYGMKNNAGYGPSAWNFQYSDNGTDWTNADSQSGISWGAPYQYFTFDSVGEHRYWRVYITERQGNQVNMHELKLYLTGLQVYSETTIKTQGSYSLKGFAEITESLNKTLTRTIGSPINLSGIDTLTFDLRSSRTGSNIKIGIHDSGGTTTEITPVISQANVFQTITWDISGVSNANKDAIDSIIITILNADADNTFYIDNFLSVAALTAYSESSIKTQGNNSLKGVAAMTTSLNKTFTRTVSPVIDLTDKTIIKFDIYAFRTGQNIKIGIHDSGGTTTELTPNVFLSNVWETKTWDISAVANADKNAIDSIIITILNADAENTFYLDNMFGDTATPTYMRGLSLFQYSKGKRVERHFYCQWNDGQIWEATTAPPGITTGVFGPSVFTGNSNPLPAVFNVINEKMLLSTGVDAHQISAGIDDYIDKFIFYSSASTLPLIPAIGTDYTDQVNDASTATYASIGGAGTNATDALCICTQVQANRLYFKMTANVNSNASAMTIYYFNGAWTTVGTIVDGTIASAGKTLGQSGYITWTAPTDAIPKYMFGQNGFWLKIVFSAAISATVEISTATFGSALMPLQNMWDGTMLDGIEAQMYYGGAYYTYGTSAIKCGKMLATDTMVFSTSDPAEALFFDVGNTPQTNAVTLTIKYLNSAGTWTTIAGTTDYTTGFKQSGFIILGRQANIKPQQYNGLPYFAYWYQITTNATFSGAAISDLNVGMTFIPYFDISDFGIGISNAIWKNRACYVFDQDPAYLVISADGQPQILSGSDSAIYKAGDGRSNRILAAKSFYNELLVGQEERGTAGGCITLIQGTTPANMGKIILSTRYGILNGNCLEVIDGFTFGDKAEMTAGFMLSRRGVLFTDGRTVRPVPNFEQVRNYFDPSHADCIRTGYESLMYLKYDSMFNILNIGLVSGASATEVNKWLIYDLFTLTFSEDNYPAAISSITEAEAASGNVPIIQLGAGATDGIVYVLNNGTDDVSTAVDSYVIKELNAKGMVINPKEIIVQTKAQAAGNMTITPYMNGVAKTAITKPLTAKNTNELVRRNRFPFPGTLVDSNISVKYEHNQAGESFYLLDWGISTQELSEQ